MRPDTRVWLKCESVGRPDDTMTVNCSAREAMINLAQWILTVYMGSKIRIIMARTEAELGDDRRSAAQNDVMADLESILNQGGTPDNDEVDRELETRDGRS